MNGKWKLRLIRTFVPLLGTTLILGDCDPTLQTTVENGIISAANSLFAAILQALVQLGQENAATTTALIGF
ncbi:MAG: hypothetical protein U1D55_14835 [Phycisphaerae bacterium]